MFSACPVHAVPRGPQRKCRADPQPLASQQERKLFLLGIGGRRQFSGYVFFRKPRALVDFQPNRSETA
ncbi:MAG: hypothetical protein DWH98_07870 [Planctomycetota bacterium]|nr:MAG: hypothetical protein DWH98_07870 [Planctomycetota bacterium]